MDYLGGGLAVVTWQIPLAYDLDDGWLWRLAGDAPWDARYIAELAGLMESLQPDDLAARRSRVPTASPLFSLERQRRQVCAFVTDVARG